MSDRYFIDTNIFVYSCDMDSAKRQKSQELIEKALTQGVGFISFQVVQEFINVALRKSLPPAPMSPQEVKTYLIKILSPLCEIFPNIELYERTLDIQEKTQFHFYDSLIVASALQGGAKILYSEDLSSGQRIDYLTIRNPFL